VIGVVSERIGGLVRSYHRVAWAVADGRRKPTVIASDRRGRDLYPTTNLGRVRAPLLAPGLLLPCDSRTKVAGPVLGPDGAVALAGTWTRRRLGAQLLRELGTRSRAPVRVDKAGLPRRLVRVVEDSFDETSGPRVVQDVGPGQS
jgi:hypothetical protein